jgi:hypothetical protein
VHVVVMAKAPRPGQAKTRLAGALGDAGTARLAGRMLRHAVAQAADAGLGPVELCVTPDAGDDALDALTRRHGLALTLQGEGDLGQRMERALSRALAGAKAAIVIGTDAPALDAAMLREAAACLTRCDAVFVPALDGGFVLLGLTRCPGGLLAGLRWSHPRVLRDTQTRLAAHGFTPALLPAVPDIDTPDDLRHLPSGWLDPSD